MLHPELLSFLLAEESTSELISSGVNAPSGAAFISTSHGLKTTVGRVLCQCSIRSCFHFYVPYAACGLIWRDLCQCSIRSCFHFYPRGWDLSDEQLELCQCSIRSCFHFYCMKKICNKNIRRVSMLHPELLSFLQQRIYREKSWEKLCQCSIRSCFHFYPVILEALILAAHRGCFCR